MGSMFSKLKEVKDLAGQAKKLQGQLKDEFIVTEKSGIKITMNGNQVIEKIEISDELLGKKDKLENGLKDAINDGIKKVQKIMTEKMKGMDEFKSILK
ncbi:YbaB/EbfC family nucleoid-associated protein [Patescibacteria group bacterium]|nr:YbaB/EbfC family nucleoid-associated protein [Patescibacteria group bacterium]